MILNEPVKRHLKPMIALGHLYKSFSRGNKQDRKKIPIKHGWRQNSKNFKEGQERKF